MYFALQSLEPAMLDLDKALADIESIRSQVARGTQFRGYGPATVALTGVLAIVAAGIQSVWLEDAREQVTGYLVVWIGTAVIAAALIGAETITRSRRLHSGLADEMIYAAIEQLIPVGVAGALLTFVLVRFSAESLWMLPGLWQLFFSLGIFASCRLLPKALFTAGSWYLATGLVCLAIHDGSWSPWAMGIPFGIGQFIMSAILYCTLGGLHGEE
jgi:hypothetical protein